MDIKRQFFVFFAIGIFSAASMFVLIKADIDFYHGFALFMISSILGIMSAVFLIGFGAGLIIDRLRKEEKARNLGDIFEGATAKSVSIMVVGAALALSGFLNLRGWPQLLSIAGMLVFLYGFYQSFPIIASSCPMPEERG